MPFAFRLAKSQTICILFHILKTHASGKSPLPLEENTIMHYKICRACGNLSAVFISQSHTLQFFCLFVYPACWMSNLFSVSLRKERSLTLAKD